MKDIMLDIETLGTSNNALIVQIGACYFDRYIGEIGETFLRNIRIQDSLNKGFEVDEGAIIFWLKHNPTFLLKPCNLETVLNDFRQFINKKALIWSHATFDSVIVANAYKKLNQSIPFYYRNIRDIRTLVDLTKVKYKKEEGEDPKTHNALDDCLFQVDYCSKCFQKLRLK